MSEYFENEAAHQNQAVVTLQGASRQIYGFTPFPLDAPPRGGGIYIFARPPVNPVTQNWTALYIGHTDDFRQHVDSGHAWLANAARLGATHVLIHFCNRGEEERREVEDDLLRTVHPPLNELEKRAA